MKRRLGNLLIAAGLAVAAWPAATWVYGLYWQHRLAADFPSPPARAVGVSPADAETRAAVTESAREPRENLKEPKKPEPSRPIRTASAAVPTERVRPETRTTPRAPSTPKAAAQPAREQVASAKEATLPVRRQPFRAGQAFARLHIPRIGLDAMVVSGITNTALRRGPGHLPGTGMPGENRNCAIAAHRDAWFRKLYRVRKGDSIRIETADAVYEYVVGTKRVVTPDRGDLLDQGARPVLTLITCTGPGYPHSKYRLLVFCDLRSETPRG